MEVDERKLRLIFSTLNNLLKDGFIVMNNYGMMPKCIPSDIDITVSQSDFNTLDKVVKELAMNCELVITQKIWHHYRKCAYILVPEDNSIRFQLDFFSDFSLKRLPNLLPWRLAFVNVRNEGLFYVPSYEYEVVFQLMRRFFKGDLDIERATYIYNSYANSDKKSLQELGTEVFNNNWNNVRDLLVNRSLHTLPEDKAKQILEDISRRNTSISYKLRYIYSELRRFIYRLRYPVGISVSILSPDGGGKSSLINNLEKATWASFHGIVRRYLRPGFLKSPGEYFGVQGQKFNTSNPNPHEIQLDSTMKSLFRFLVYCGDYVLGGLFVSYKYKVLKNIIFYDRYYEDFIVDKKRHKLRIFDMIPSLVYYLIPTPDIVFIIGDRPENIYARKRELSFEEIVRQQEVLKKLANKSAKYIVIPKDLSEMETTDFCIREIVKYKSDRTARLLR